MSYVYERFGAITLPTYNREMDLAPVGPRSRLLATVAGSFDGDGAARSAQQFPHALALEAIVSEASTALQRDALDALRAAVGTRAYLYRRADDDSSVQRALCRLSSMAHERQYKTRTGYQPIKLQFQQLGPWLGTIYGGPWVLDGGVILDDGYTFDAATTAITTSLSPATLVLPNPGNLPAYDVRVIVECVAGSISALTVAGITWQWSVANSAGALLSALQTLTVDCGAEAVTRDGVDLYQYFALDASHQIERWAEIPAGGGVATLTWVGSATLDIAIEYREAWA